MAAVDEEKRKRTAFPTDIPAQPIYGRGAVRQTAAPSQPLDAQAAADREAIGRAWGVIKDTSQKAGAAIADIGTLPIRAAAGAYDSAVIRPMRAAGLNAAYTSPLVNPASNASGASMTPFYDQMRSRDASGVQAISSNEGRNNKQPIANPAAPAAAAIVAATPDGVNASQTSPQAPPVTTSRAAVPTTPKQEGVDVGFGIRRMEGPGGTPLYTNIQPGAPMPAQPPQPMYRQPQDQPVQRVQPERQRQDVVMPRLNTRGGVFSAMADFTNQAGNALGAVAQNRANNQQDRAGREDAKLGLDANRYALDAAITQNRFGMDRQRAGLDAAKAQDDMATNRTRREASQVEIDAARQSADLRRQYLEAPDEATRAAIGKKLTALSGKSEKADAQWDSIVVNGGTDAMGNRIGGTAMLYNKVTGEMKPAGGTAKQGAPASLAEYAAAMRQANPGKTLTDADLKARYETKYGAQK